MKKEKKKISEIINSNSFLNNTILVLGLILFVLIIIMLVYFVLKTKNPNAFKTEDEILFEEFQNYVAEQERAKAEAAKNDGTFSVHFNDITVKGSLPKRVKSKFHIECFEDGLINIYSKYTYAIAKTDYGYAKGVILKIRVIKDSDLSKVPEEEGEYTVIDKYEDYSIIAIVPKGIEYFENDEISKDNYEELSKYRKEIIDSVKVEEIPIGLAIDGRES